jgi:hypothetical protein
MRCLSCGTPLLPHMKVCPTCGTPVSYNPVGASAPAAFGSNSDPTPPLYPQSSLPACAPVQSPSQPPPTMYPGIQAPPAPPYSGPQHPQHLLYPQYPPPPLSPQKRGLSKGLTILLAIFVLLIIVGSGIIYYFAVPYPAQLHANATATAQAQANENATGTAVVINNENATATALAQATLTAQQTMYSQATSGTPALNDSLAQNSGSQWDNYDSAANGGCIFANGAYHVKEQQAHFFQPCFANAPTFSNFTFQVQMTILSGNIGGIIFRANTQTNKFYLLQFGTDKSYQLYVYVNNSGSSSKTLLDGFSNAINGSNQPNLLTLIAQGSQLTIFVNKQYVDSTTDSTYSSGQLGLLAYYKNAPTEVAFSNAEVWKH